MSAEGISQDGEGDQLFQEEPGCCGQADLLPLGRRWLPALRTLGKRPEQLHRRYPTPEACSRPQVQTVHGERTTVYTHISFSSLKGALISKCPSTIETNHLNFHEKNKICLLSIAVFAVKLPGRESRAKEPFFQSMQQIVDELLDVLLPVLKEKPFAMFGHR